MRLSGRLTSAVALALATLIPTTAANAAPARDAELRVPIGKAVSIDHVLTDTHITSTIYAGNADAAVMLFEDYDPVHLAGEKWFFRSTGVGDYVRIENSGGAFCLQPGDPANAVAGMGIVQRACSTGSKAQRWTLDGIVTSSDFTIRPYDDDSLAITPADNGRYSLLRLGQVDGPGHLNQFFRIRTSDL